MVEFEPGRTWCGVSGKLIFADKNAARAALPDLGKKATRWHVQWCPFCERYHLSSSASPRRGKKDSQKVTRGKR